MQIGPRKQQPPSSQPKQNRKRYCTTFVLLSVNLTLFVLLRFGFTVLEWKPNSIGNGRFVINESIFGQQQQQQQEHNNLVAVQSPTTTTIPKTTFFLNPNERRGSGGGSSGSVRSSSSSSSILDHKLRLKLQREEQWDITLQPKIVWLASYPNSGTSYTMTMVERASNLSTASNYGAEVTYQREDSIPIYPQYTQGPFWDGLSGKLGAIRYLPETFILTKTHCGGRCIKCTAEEYVLDVSDFLSACQRTTGRNNKQFMEASIPANAIAGVIHLIRNPFHNTIARFHLERRNMIEHEPNLIYQFPSNATGFQQWCHYLDQTYNTKDRQILSRNTRKVLQSVPCYAEFYKWTQWHNRVIEMIPYLGWNTTKDHNTSILQQKRVVPSLTVHYEDYATNFNSTTDRIFQFLQQPVISTKRSFRHLPLYEDHYTTKERYLIQKLIQHVATDATWKQIQHYFDN